MAPSTPASLTGADINAFLLRECARVSAGSAKGRVAELRSVLRFLYLAGHHPVAARHGRASGRRVALGHPATAPDVSRGRPAAARQLRPQHPVRPPRLRDHDAGRAAGVALHRGRAAGAGATWTGGRANSSCAARAVARIGCRCRSRSVRPWSPTCRRAATLQGARHLFLTCRAPRGPIRADLVGDVVERACMRAGLPKVGPHRLRHALAGELLRRGAGLVAISQVLRHQDLATTALYAKVDLDALRRVAQPWPGALGERAGAGPGRLPAAAPFAGTRTGRGRLAAAALRGLPRRSGCVHGDDRGGAGLGPTACADRPGRPSGRGG